MQGIEVPGCFQGTRQAVHVMVVGKIIQGEVTIYSPFAELALEGIGDLEIIAVVVAGIQPFVTS